MMGGGWMGFGGLWMILFWLAVIVGIVALAKLLWSGSQRKPASSRAMQILEERYARGDINREEFEVSKGTAADPPDTGP